MTSDAKTAKKTPAFEDSKTENENSSIVSIAPDKNKPGSSDPGQSDNENSSIVSIAGDTDKPQRSDTAFNNENSTIANANVTAHADPVQGPLTPTSETDGSGKTVATCRRYFPMAGQTLTVPCDSN